MKCHVCQNEVRDDARFCPVCGAKQETAPAPQSAPEVIPQSQVIPEPVHEILPENVVTEQSAAQVIPEAAVFETAPAEPLEYKYDPSISYSALFMQAKAEAEQKAQPEPAPAPKYTPAPKFASESQVESTYEYTPQPQQAPAAQTVYQNVYQQVSAPQRPYYQLPAQRSLVKMIFLGLITFGIYNLVIMSRIAEETNMVASKHDGERTQQFLWMLYLGGLTLGIYAFVWMHGLCNRIGGEVRRRGIDYKFGASDFWIFSFLFAFVGAIVIAIVIRLVFASTASIAALWLAYILTSAAICVGPFIFIHKLCKASNLMNQDYNRKG